MAAGEELLDLGQDRVGLREPGRVVRAVDLEVPRTGDVVGEVAAELHRYGVVAGVDDQGGRGERRQDRPHVDPEIRFQCRSQHPRAGAHALEHPELAYRPDRREHSLGCCAAAPRREGDAAEFLEAGDLLRRRRVVLTQLGKGARPQLGRVAIQVVPATAGRVRERAVEDQRPRSLIPNTTAFAKPTASMTASISAARSSSKRTFGTGSDSPFPALSNMTTRQNVARWSKKTL